MQAWGQAGREVKEEALQVLQTLSLSVSKHEFVNNMILPICTEKASHCL